ncbi:MAG TPA: hypothetical protein VN969_46640 [Streptosporangiaceae bacterium]|nr:hypothetical protein [Streptosporangiaceae bacterium]
MNVFHPEEHHRPHDLDSGHHQERRPAIPAVRPARGMVRHLDSPGALLAAEQEQPDQERRGSQHGGEEEPGAAARGEDAHRRRALAGGGPGRCARGRMEHGHPQPGGQQQQEDHGIGRGQTGQPCAGARQADACRGQPPGPPLVDNEADERLRQ